MTTATIKENGDNNKILSKKYFSKFKKPLIPIPDLAKDQVESFKWLVEKGIKEAKKDLRKVPLLGRTLPHQVMGKFGATRVTLVPASPGTGVIAGLSARAVLEYAGVQDVLTKVYGSTSAKNVLKATMDGLMKLRTKEVIERLRGVEVQPVKRW